MWAYTSCKGMKDEKELKSMADLWPMCGFLTQIQKC